MIERQFAFPRRQQRQVVTGGSSGPYWAVNVGSLPAAVLSVTDGVISGGVVGTAALLTRDATGKPKVTDRRQQFERYQDGEAIEDGTLIQLDNVSGKVTIVFANCEPTPGLEGLEPEPGE
ncbi:MAG: hypothetical protein KDB01_27815 [Planctomycetaceae bacterium]|nr:hypothetical protein [Planctomycetaceae bacterium]